MGAVESGGRGAGSMTSTIFKLLLFFAVCTVLTGYLAFTIGNIHLFQHTYTLNATFDSADGLLKDDNVKVAGVVVGKVTGVKIDQGKARVSVIVTASVKVPTDSSAAIRWRNLIGQRYIYLYPGTGSTVFKDGATIGKTRSVVNVGDLFNKLGPILKAVDPKQVNTFLDAITQALDGNQEKLRQSIDNLAVVAQSLGARDEAIGRLVDNANTVAGAINDREAQIRVALDNLVLITQTFSQNTDVLNSAVTELGDYTDNFGALLANNRVEIDRIVTNLNSVTDEVRVKLPVVDSILQELDEAAKRLALNRYGEWLNNNVLCGALFNPPQIMSNDPCISGTGSLQNAQPPPPSLQAQRETSGAAAVNQLLAGALPG
jgi:phospholipid/cholesterol/gamma-HCH transport system substrate-binding protein